MFSLFPPGFPAVPRYFIHTCDMDAIQISQGKPQNVPRVDAGFIKHSPCGWRTSQSRARSSRVYHPSYPVPGRRPARLDWASSRPHLAVDALALLLAFGSNAMLGPLPVWGILCSIENVAQATEMNMRCTNFLSVWSLIDKHTHSFQ